MYWNIRYKLICSVITDKTNGKWKIDMILISLQQVVSFYTTWSCWSSTSKTGEDKDLYRSRWLYMYVNLPKPSFPYFYTNLFETWCVAYNCLVYV